MFLQAVAHLHAPGATAGLQPRGVATEMTAPPCVAPSSSRGSPWAWHGSIGVSSATQDHLVSTSWSWLRRHHGQPSVGCEGAAEAVGHFHLTGTLEPRRCVRMFDAAAQQPQDLHLSILPWAEPHQCSWNVIN